MKGSSQRLSDSELLHIISLSKLAIAVYTGENIIIETANDAMLSIWKKDQSVIGKQMSDAIPELQNQPFINILKNVWRTGITYEAKEMPGDFLVNGVPKTFYFDFEYRAIKREDGSMYCILNTATDVTERYTNRQLQHLSREQQRALEKEQALNEELAATNEELSSINEELQQTQEEYFKLNSELEERVTSRTKALAESEQKLRYMLADAPMAIALMTGEDFIIASANKKLLEVWGKDQTIIGKPLLESLPELKGQTYINLLKEVYQTGKPYYGQEVKAVLQRQGKPEEVYSNFVYYPLKNEQGKTDSIVLIANMITDLVVARNNAQKSQEILNIAAESADLGIWQFNLQTADFFASPQCNRIFGFNTGAALHYYGILDCMNESHRDGVRQDIRKAVSDEQPFDLAFRITRQDDHQPRWVRAAGKLIYNSEGIKTNLTGIFQDITQQQNEAQRKNDFIGIVSHELKTPLTSMSAFLQMLEIKAGTEQDAFTANLTSKAQKQVRKMTTMVNSFLNVSRLESGKLTLDTSRFDLALLVKESEEETLSMYNSHSIVFHPVETIFVEADRDKIGHVISNLISNAVKYSAANTTINIACVSVTNNLVKFSVKDEGIGIKGEDIPKLFERYYRIEDRKTKSISGFGIGLYLCAEIIHLHGGHIWVESEVGTGSNFYFTLPVLIEPRS